MILLSLGSNLPSKWGNRAETLNIAVNLLKNISISVMSRSDFYFSPPMGLRCDKITNTYKITSDNANIQNDFNLPSQHYINIALWVDAKKPAPQLLYGLKQIEKIAGRQNGRRWASRPLDIDIIDYKQVGLGGMRQYNQKLDTGFIPLTLPHPGLANRAFVLEPIAEIAPFWHHPKTGKTARQMLNELK